MGFYSSGIDFQKRWRSFRMRPGVALPHGPDTDHIQRPHSSSFPEDYDGRFNRSGIRAANNAPALACAVRDVGPSLLASRHQHVRCVAHRCALVGPVFRQEIIRWLSGSPTLGSSRSISFSARRARHQAVSVLELPGAHQTETFGTATTESRQSKGFRPFLARLASSRARLARRVVAEQALVQLTPMTSVFLPVAVNHFPARLTSDLSVDRWLRAGDALSRRLLRVVSLKIPRA